MTLDLSDKKFGLTALLLQAAFIVLFGVFCRYGDQAKPSVGGNSSSSGSGSGSSGDGSSISNLYPMFQDVHVMIFVGFGFLMTFMRYYGFSGVGVNMLIASVVIQWSLIVNGLFHLKNGRFTIDLKSLISADFACASVLISFGALLGRVSPLQCLLLAMLEIPIFVANEYVGLNKFKASDMGGSMFVHVFGAYFGIAASKTLAGKRDRENANDRSNYCSDQFAMIGTLFLFLYWPSFNAALADSDSRHRAVLNTYISLAACVVVSFAVSSLVEGGRFEMSHVQNATLAGGVAVGTAADMMVQPWGAAAIGCLAAAVSVIGYRFVTPRLRSNNFLDTCGVNNLHGMPGILAAMFGVIFSGLATADEYGSSLHRIFPARAPTPSSPVAASSRSIGSSGGRSAGMQAVFQAAACSMTLLCAIIGGLLTGFVLRLSLLDRLPSASFYLDTVGWNLPADALATSFVERTAVLTVGDGEDANDDDKEEATSPV